MTVPAMPEDSSPWPLRWIVDEHRCDTGFAMLRRPLQAVEEPAFEKMAADHRMIGFTHYGPFPLYHESYDRRAKDRAPEEGWDRPEVQACEAWAHCFRDPGRYLPPGRPRMLISGSDFVNGGAARIAAGTGGWPGKRWDLVYSCLPTWLNELQKNWDFARACLARLAEAGLRVVVAGRAGVPGNPPYQGVDYLPQLPWPAFMRVMASARAAFLPNWWDASPCVLTQALALDVPVLVNRQILGGWKYVTPDTGAFFCDESDVVDAFFSLLDAPVRPRAWLGENGYGVGPAGRRLAAELRALGGSSRAAELTFAMPTSEPPWDP
jgi:hypothetical protein